MWRLYTNNPVQPVVVVPAPRSPRPESEDVPVNESFVGLESGVVKSVPKTAPRLDSGDDDDDDSDTPVPKAKRSRTSRKRQRKRSSPRKGTKSTSKKKKKTKQSESEPNNLEGVEIEVEIKQEIESDNDLGMPQPASDEDDYLGNEDEEEEEQSESDPAAGGDKDKENGKQIRGCTLCEVTFSEHDLRRSKNAYLRHIECPAHKAVVEMEAYINDPANLIVPGDDPDFDADNPDLDPNIVQPVEVFTCSICKTSYCGQRELERHTLTLLHQKNAEAAAAGGASEPVNVNVRVMPDVHPPQEQDISSDSPYCGVCNHHFNAPWKLTPHLSSKAHLQAVETARRSGQY